ncbi:uncharacterized protein OCT59_003484 [Rhizophagus irregularis]|nr:hypothetical protein OCT59_003484 [Rhizophagus irregularis]GBC37449.2 kinase-like domain-containing protein [Rhizophagus irregularis DAOM 181602=DAOM 197198]
MFIITNLLNFVKTKDKLKVIFSRDLRDDMVNCGVCSDCKEANTGYAWCNKCDPGRFKKEGITSGNDELDKLICERQQQTLHFYDNFEWITYDKFSEVETIGEGGFSIIYSAKWLEGAPIYDNKKSHTEPIKVALKKLKTSDIAAFTNEIKIHGECNYTNFHITQLYGITKNLNTGEFTMVLEYATNGSLRDYLKNKSKCLKWGEKLEILINIIYDLEFIHDRNYIHKDLHSGNILQFFYNGWIDTKITDLGCAQQLHDILNSSNSISVCGVFPYMAPEILNGKQYTFASDIYSFGIIIVEVSTGKPPYGNIPHDEYLAIAICNGRRPKIAKGTPKCYIDLVDRCLDADPEERPSSKEILHKIRNWRFHDSDQACYKKLFLKKMYHNNKDIKLAKEFIDEDCMINSQESSAKTMLHPGAIYTSQVMSFNSLCEPKNSVGIQVEDSEDSDSYEPKRSVGIQSEVSDLQLIDLNVLEAKVNDSKNEHFLLT